VNDRDVAELMPQVYDELRRLAAGYLRRERPGQTLQATALVNEAFVRLSQERGKPFENRTHFLAIAALSMRQILVQRARAKHADKRGGGADRITLDESIAGAAPPPNEGVDVLALDAALTRLADLDPQQAKIVELRYFGGLTIEETAEVLDISRETVNREWNKARAWLYDALRQGGGK